MECFYQIEIVRHLKASPIDLLTDRDVLPDDPVFRSFILGQNCCFHGLSFDCVKNRHILTNPTILLETEKDRQQASKKLRSRLTPLSGGNNDSRARSLMFKRSSL